MSEHHFVVKYSIQNGWEWDTDTENSNFPEGTIYTEVEGWRKSGDLLESDISIYDKDEQLSHDLMSALNIMNTIRIQEKESKR